MSSLNYKLMIDECDLLSGIRKGLKERIPLMGQEGIEHYTWEAFQRINREENAILPRGLIIYCGVEIAVMEAKSYPN